MNPVVTPATMFAISVRVSPCRARVFVLSSPGVTFTLPGVSAPDEAGVPGSRAMRIAGWNVRASWPFGPFTVTVWPSILRSTPEGIVTGRRPMRLISADHQTYARTSPPRPLRSASRPLMRPADVDTIAIPSPPSTRGISLLRA